MKRSLFLKQDLLAFAPCFLLLSGCTSSDDMRTRLANTGWTAEPVLVGAESTIGEVQPSTCEAMFELLQNGGSAAAVVLGFKHEHGAYLLVREWNAPAPLDLAAELRKSAIGCSSMTMEYDSAVLVWDITPVHGVADSALYRLAAEDDTSTQIAEMLVGARSVGRRAVLARVLAGPDGLGETDEEALSIVFSTLD